MSHIKTSIEIVKRIQKLSWKLKIATDSYFEDPANEEKQQTYILTLLNEIKELQSILNRTRDLRDDFFPF